MEDRLVRKRVLLAWSFGLQASKAAEVQFRSLAPKTTTERPSGRYQLRPPQGTRLARVGVVAMSDQEYRASPEETEKTFPGAVLIALV